MLTEKVVGEYIAKALIIEPLVVSLEFAMDLFDSNVYVYFSLSSHTDCSNVCYSFIKQSVYHFIVGNKNLFMK